MDTVEGIGGAVGAVAVPDVDAVVAVLGDGGIPGGGGRFGDAGPGIAIGAAAVAGVGTGIPGSRLLVRGEAVVVVHDDLVPVHIALAHRPDVGSGIPEVADKKIVHRLGVGEVLHQVTVVTALGRPAGAGPVPAVAGADKDGLAAQRTVGLALAVDGRLTLHRSALRRGRDVVQGRHLLHAGRRREEIGDGPEAVRRPGVGRQEMKVAKAQHLQGADGLGDHIVAILEGEAALEERGRQRNGEGDFIAPGRQGKEGGPFGKGGRKAAVLFLRGRAGQQSGGQDPGGPFGVGWKG